MKPSSSITTIPAPANEASGGSVNRDLFKLDVAKLEHALECKPFNEHFDSIRSYFDESLVQSFRALSIERVETFNEKYTKLRDTFTVNPNANQIDKSKQASIVEKPFKLELNAPKEENINDWLDDLIN